MRCTGSLITTSQALRRVFITSLNESTCRPTILHHPTTFSSSRSSIQPFILPLRHHSSTSPNAPPRLPRDEEILGRWVHLVSADQTLGPPRSRDDILRGMNRQTEFLVQVAGPEEGRWSVCKIMSKQMLREAEKARMKNKKQAMKGSKVKELELNWAIDEHDLQHRLDRLQGFLEKGVKVDVVLAGKKKGRQATPEECRVVLKKVRERIRETEGAREVRAQEGEVPGPVMLHLEGRGKGRKDESGKVEVEVVGQGNHEMGSE